MNTSPSELFECPKCGLGGPPDLFEPQWPQRLAMLVSKHHGLGIPEDLSNLGLQDALYLLNWLERLENQ